MLNVLTQLRNQRGLTQEDVACALGVSSRTVLRWESPKGNPRLDDMKKIAELFGVSISYLVGEQIELCHWWNKQNIRSHTLGGFSGSLSSSEKIVKGTELI